MSNREIRKKVDQLVLEGRTRAEIAEATGVSPCYAGTRRQRLKDQAGRRDSVALASLRKLAIAAPGVALADALRAVQEGGSDE